MSKPNNKAAPKAEIQVQSSPAEPIITSYSVTPLNGGFYITVIKTQGDVVLSRKKMSEEEVFPICINQLTRAIKNEFQI